MSADEPTDIPCPPCNETGSVISNLGGTPQRIACPWCDGTGRLQPGHDAQARWRESSADAPSSG